MNLPTKMIPIKKVTLVKFSNENIAKVLLYLFNTLEKAKNINITAVSGDKKNISDFRVR